MIVHIVLLQARPDLTESEKVELGQAVRALAGISQVQDLTWGPDFSGRGRGYTHGAVMHFDGHEGLAAYQEDPVHKRVVEVFNRLAPQRLIIDYEVSP